MRTHPPHAQTPPPSSYAHLPDQAFDINITELARRIGLDDDDAATEQPQQWSTPQPSPISILPPEVLSQIFTYCIPQDQFPVPCRTEAPLLLTHVSGYWRELALALPHLWTALHINYKDAAEDTAVANLWLSRSGNQLLSLSVAIDFNEQPQQGILDVLCQHSRRWKHIRFDFRHLFCPPMYSLDLAQGDVPNLKAFEFHARDVSNTNVSPITRLLASASELREVTWVDDLADTDTLLELPLSRLTHLSLAMDYGTLDYLQVLHQCDNLEYIRISRPFSHTQQSRPPLVLSKLASLNISYDLTSVLDHLVLPALRSVSISSDGDKQAQVQPHSYSQSQSHLPPLPHAYAHGALPASTSSPSIGPSSPPMEGWDPTALFSLIDRSACAITHLSINSPMTEDTLVRCLHKMSASLATLAIRSVPVGDLLLRSLTLLPRRQPEHWGFEAYGDSDFGGEWEGLCPHLEEISLDTRVACSPNVLAAMAESRLHRARVEMPDGYCRALRKLRAVDGHRDLERLREFHKLSRVRSGPDRWMADGKFTLEVIPRRSTSKSRSRGFIFSRKLCVSR